MVTRKLDKLIPEFDEFLLLYNPPIFPNIPLNDAAVELVQGSSGDRKMVRFGQNPWSWVNHYSLGIPVELSPDNNDPSIATDNHRINNFVFDLSKQRDALLLRARESQTPATT